MTERAPTKFSEDRFAGCLVGLAVGDALGTTLEFTPRSQVEPIDDMIGGGPFGLAPGQWTDDTSMALCLAESLVENETFDLHDQIKRYVRWFREGYLSSTGDCFDIGIATCAALTAFEQTGDPKSGSTDPESCGNGSLMRLAPVPMRYYDDPEDAIDLAGESSRTTHQSQCCVDACRYFAGLLVGAISGESKDSILRSRYSPVGGGWEAGELEARIEAVAAGSYKTKSEAQIESTGFVVHTLEAALWAFSQTDDYRSALLKAVNLGHDADTTGAVCGQIAGAYYGLSGIPKDWVDQLAMKETILDLCRRLQFRN